MLKANVLWLQYTILIVFVCHNMCQNKFRIFISFYVRFFFSSFKNGNNIKKYKCLHQSYQTYISWFNESGTSHACWIVYMSIIVLVIHFTRELLAPSWCCVLFCLSFHVQMFGGSCTERDVPPCMWYTMLWLLPTLSEHGLWFDYFVCLTSDSLTTTTVKPKSPMGECWFGKW